MATQRPYSASRSYTLVHLLLDVVTITVLYSAILLIRYPDNFAAYFNPFVLATMIGSAVLALAIIGAYDRNSEIVSVRFTAEYAIAALFSFILTYVIIYVFAAYTYQINPGRFNVSLPLALFPVISLAYRRILDKLWSRQRRERALFVLGIGDLARDFHAYLTRSQWSQPVSFFDPNDKAGGQPLIAGDNSSPAIQTRILERLAEDEKSVEAIIIAEEPDHIPHDLLVSLVSIHFSHAKVLNLESFYSETWKLIPLSQVSPTWAFDEGFYLIQSMTYSRAKRVFDILFSLSGLIVLSPVLLAVYCLVKVGSPGEAVFRQTRIGQNNREFTLYKFRTMREGADREDPYTRSGDERITRLGSFLRRTRLDELPQLWNVLRGDMSVIGPRAEWNKLVRKYEDAIPYYHFRHLVKPGITGWAQVNYPYGENEEDAMEKLKYDLYYVRHYSLLLDLAICIKTIYAVVSAGGR